MNTEQQTQQKKTWTKEEVIAAIKECAAKLGRVPRQPDMKRDYGMPDKTFARLFGNYTKALRDSGFEGRGSGFMLSTEELFTEWAAIVRKIGAVPSATEYVLHSSHSLTPIRKRFRYLSDVPAGMVQYAIENGLEEQWRDVLEIAKKYRREARTGGWRRKPETLSSTTCGPRVMKDRPVYGAPLIRGRWRSVP